jgi:hypothetical protein
MLPWAFNEGAAVETHMAQLQLSTINDGEYVARMEDVLDLYAEAPERCG